MGYLKDFHSFIRQRNAPKFLELWEEYCTGDTPCAEEYVQILEAIQESDFAEQFGKLAEAGIPLWQCIEDEEASYQVLKRLVDLQTTNSAAFAEQALAFLKKRFGGEPQFKERIHLVGLRTKENFQGALSNYELLSHMKEGKCVYHTGGWGTGEVIEVSPIREQATIEFEYVPEKKHLSFKNAFNMLKPLPDDHFLSRRFMDPDALEEEAKRDPVATVKILLRDLGPKTAGEIKDEMAELVIPEKEWTKWWQSARAKLKKDPFVETPASLKEPFVLQEKAISQEERLLEEIQSLTDIPEVVLAAYNAVRDFPGMLKKEEVRRALKERFGELLQKPRLGTAQELQIALFMEQAFDGPAERGRPSKEIVSGADEIAGVIDEMEILAFKKRALVAVKNHRPDWNGLFLSLLFTISPSQLREYILEELNGSEETRPRLVEALEELVQRPEKNPEAFVWYFQKLTGKEGGALPFGDKQGQCLFFEGLLTLLHKIEFDNSRRDLVKKILNRITAKRFELVRKIFQGSEIAFAQEVILLASKCHSISNQDKKIFSSLAQVAHPSLAPKKEKNERLQLDGNIVWTTSEGFRKTQERAHHIGTVEIVENAREVEEARSHGDLRENSEYKFAVEKRKQLQGELKRLGDQLNKARIITEQDISNSEVGIGSCVELLNSRGEKLSYTILGPWEADPDNNILSFQSKLAQAMVGRKVNETFRFGEEEYKVTAIGSFLN